MVTVIEPNGVVTDGYFFVTGGQSSPAQITVDGSQVKVITRAKSVAELSRLGDDRLAGSLTSPTGITFSITLTRVSTQTSLAKQAQAFDPQSLVGEWVGTFVPKHSPGAAPASSRYTMVIKRVAEPKVFLHVEVAGHLQWGFDGIGTLDGNRLTYARTELTIYVGDTMMEMRGSAAGGSLSAPGFAMERYITLYKKK